MVAATAHGGGNNAPVQEKPSVPDVRQMEPGQLREFLLGLEQKLFHRTREQLLAEPKDIMGANHVVLADDMLTVISDTSRILPSQFEAFGTSFEGHGFYEASSIRKINGTYYFIYSDENSSILSYATSQYPDRDFVYRGILQSNGDVGLDGRKGEDRLNMTANNHGSLECVNGQWYIFYHRQTHNSTYSRQACAEPVIIAPDGSIAQAECTSCGLNGGPLPAEGEYPAAIACNITNGKMPHATNRIVGADIPYITHSGSGLKCERFITNIKPDTRIVFKYFAFSGPVRLTLKARGGGGRFAVFVGGEAKGEAAIPAGDCWTETSLTLEADGDAALELRYEDGAPCQLLSIRFDRI